MAWQYNAAIMLSLAKHTVLITGSTMGVGLSIAKSLATAGANLVLHGKPNDPGSEQAVAACREIGVEATLIAGDLAGPTEECVEQVFQAAISANPAIDILINNAGTYIDKPFLDMDLDTYERTMRLNVAAPYFLTQRFARRWIEIETRGRVLITGSINGRLAEPNHTAYDASKGAVEAMIRSLCVSLAPHGIRVNGMAPGLVRTPLTNPAFDDPRVLPWMQLHTPNGSVPGSEVCGPTAAFLVSDLAEHIHGQMILVDGGMSAWQQPDVPDAFQP